jgi:hypothetical protein
VGMLHLVAQAPAQIFARLRAPCPLSVPPADSAPSRILLGDAVLERTVQSPGNYLSALDVPRFTRPVPFLWQGAYRLSQTAFEVEK